MESAGFQFEKEQKPSFQKRKENELKFVHPQLVSKLEEDGYKVRAKKFYIKPLVDEADCEIGFVTGKSSPLYKEPLFPQPNASDTFDEAFAWVNRDDNSALDSLLESIRKYLKISSNASTSNRNSYLFTWNPNKWDWVDLGESIEHLKDVGYVERRWSCGNSKSVQKGDRIFLVRLGKEPKGIMGSGYAKSSYYVAPHWDGTEGKLANYIDIDFDILIDPKNNPLFYKDLLDSVDPEKTQQWFPQQSGTSIKLELMESLEASWFNFVQENKDIRSSFFGDDLNTETKETFWEGKAKEITQTHYERSPEARKRCLAYYGYSCKVCDFNFENHFGDIGKGFIHVHHIKQIADIGEEHEIDPVRDLIPVCPNCHAMIHSKRPPFTIEEIKQIRKNAHDDV
jgi:5-methylcytosine-specific restriction protein A